MNKPLVQKPSFTLAAGIVAIASFLLLSTPALKADEASHLKAAQDLLVAAQMQVIFSKTVDQALDMQIKQAPQLAQFRPIMTAFFSKYMSWDALKDDLAKLYANAFTEDELKDITKFYETPTGKKMAMETPALMMQGSALGQQKVQEHIGELQQAIQAAAATGKPQ